jgi:hypothetical protein
VKENEIGGQVARIGEMRISLKFLVGEPEEKRQIGRPIGLCVHGRIILEWILETWGGKVWTGFNWLTIGTSGGLL